MLLLTFILSLVLGLRTVHAGEDLAWKDDTDLTSFITRPEIKSPLYDVKIHNPNGIEEGYWFVAPYVKIHQEKFPERYYQTCQTGPHIYDAQGELIWSGACMVNNRDTNDFRVVKYNDTTYLSAILHPLGSDFKGHGIIMNTSFSTVKSIYNPVTITNFNMHELNIVDQGTKALHIVARPDLADVSALGTGLQAGWIANNGFREVDIGTGETTFEWWALDHVPLTASSVNITNLEGPHPSAWNFFHSNSVDKNADGDYLVSSRYTDCIYKISGKDGHVIWRLGGKDSSFILDGFNFSKQHDARFLHENSTHTVLSFLDNAADPFRETSDYSSALIVSLDTSATPMIARVTQRWERPDRQLSRLRGNFQLLPSGNAFICWSGNSYISEHSPDGEVLFEAKFTSHRSVSYRAYKFNFTSNPLEPPTLKAFVYGESPATSTTVLYVSWNGATEVKSWNFYRAEDSTLIGSKSKTGFETTYHSQGFQKEVYVEALAADGRVIGTSSIESTVLPAHWTSEGTKASEDQRTNREWYKQEL